MATDRSVDQDVAADVEVAEKGPEFERRVGEPVQRRRVELETADQDLYIAREDLGVGSETFIAAGAPFRPTWRTFPGVRLGRHPASGSHELVGPLGLVTGPQPRGPDP